MNHNISEKKRNGKIPPGEPAELLDCTIYGLNISGSKKKDSMACCVQMFGADG